MTLPPSTIGRFRDVSRPQPHEAEAKFPVAEATAHEAEARFSGAEARPRGLTSLGRLTITPLEHESATKTCKTWAMTAEYLRSLETAEHMMVRWMMCDASLKDRK